MPQTPPASPHVFRGDVVHDFTTAAADGAVTQKSGTVFVTKSGVCAMTIADPVSGSPGAGGDDGKRLTFISTTANAHTLTRSTTGFNDGGAGADVATFGGAKGDGLTLLAYGGKWYAENLTGVTLG